jgi:hypothetical protein
MRLLFCILFTLAPFFNLLSESAGQDWKELSGEHFIVYFTQDDKFAKDVLEESEVYYRNIASELGYPRYSEFWLWEKRVKIYIYPDHQSFLAASGQPEWSKGVAEYKTKQILSYAWSKGFTESLLPHEIAHLIFRDFVGFKGEIPLWLDEGVAQWMEEPKRREVKRLARQKLETNSFMVLEDMMHLDIRNVKYKELVYIRPALSNDKRQGVLFLSAENLIDIYYLESVSLVGFLMEKYGGDSFTNFCREMRDGKTVDEALRIAYPTHIHSIAELEEKWKEYLEKTD